MSGGGLIRNVVFWGWFEAGCEVDFLVFVQDSSLSVRSGFHTEPTRVPVCPDYAGVWRARRLSTAGRREGACHAPDAGRPWTTGQRLRVSGKGDYRESDAGTGPAGVQQVALTAAFRSSSVNSRCFFVPGARSLLRTSSPRLVRDGEPDTRRLSRCAWSAWATLSAWPSRLCSTTAP